MATEEQVLQSKAFDVLSMMRTDGLSRTRAAQIAGISTRELHERVGRVLVKRGRRWIAKPWDRIPRPVRFLSEDGVFSVVARDSRTASRIARYWNAVDRYLRTGDASVLDEFRSQSFTSYGLTYEYVTDVEVLDRLALVGEVRIDDIYANAA